VVARPVGEARQAQELVGLLGDGGSRLVDRLAVGRAGQPRPQLDVAPQLRPAGEAVMAGEGELGAGEPEGGGAPVAGAEVAEPGVMLDDEVDPTLVAGSDQVADQLRGRLELAKAGVLREGLYGHRARPFRQCLASA
jgi:hypothetical protein